MVETKTATRTARRGKDAVRPLGGFTVAGRRPGGSEDANRRFVSEVLASWQVRQPRATSPTSACLPPGRGFLEALYGNRGQADSRPGLRASGRAVFAKGRVRFRPHPLTKKNDDFAKCTEYSSRTRMRTRGVFQRLGEMPVVTAR